MNFHEYTSGYILNKRRWGVRVNLDAYTKQRIVKWDRFVEGKDSDTHEYYKLACQGMANAEHVWHEGRRPYFRLWPAIAESLTKIDTTKIQAIQCVFPVTHFSVHFAIGSEAIRIDGNNCVAMLCSILPQTGCVEIATQWIIPSPRFQGIPSWIWMKNSLTAPIFEAMVLPINMRYGQLDELWQQSQRCFQLVAAIGLMANDPSIIQPEVLNKDAARYEKTLDPKLVEKAIRNGKHGWNVGKEIEFMPHFRRPHFALRWTGKGGEIPKIVPVKGAIVKREQMTKVPTGYMDGDES